MIGRYLTSNEIVHHKNGIRDDNRPENLQLITKNNHHRGQNIPDIILSYAEYINQYAPGLINMNKVNQYKIPFYYKED